MNTKELAEFFGVTTKTVANHAKKVGIKLTKGHDSNLDIDEVKKIAKSIYGNVAVHIQMAIAETFGPQIVEKEQPRKNETKSFELSSFADNNQILTSILTLVENQQKQINHIINSTTANNQKLLEAPKLNAREEIDYIMQVVALENNYKLQEAYKLLYILYTKTYHENLVRQARNRNKQPLDYFEEQGKIEQLLNLARESFLIDQDTFKIKMDNFHKKLLKIYFDNSKKIDLSKIWED